MARRDVMDLVAGRLEPDALRQGYELQVLQALNRVQTRQRLLRSAVLATANDRSEEGDGPPATMRKAQGR